MATTRRLRVSLSSLLRCTETEQVVRVGDAENDGDTVVMRRGRSSWLLEVSKVAASWEAWSQAGRDHVIPFYNTLSRREADCPPCSRRRREQRVPSVHAQRSQSRYRGCPRARLNRLSPPGQPARQAPPGHPEGPELLHNMHPQAGEARGCPWPRWRSGGAVPFQHPPQGSKKQYPRSQTQPLTARAARQGGPAASLLHQLKLLICLALSLSLCHLVPAVRVR